MKYFIRSIKYFIYFSLICTLMICILIVIDAAEGNVQTLFKDGYKSIMQIGFFFILVAAIYPLLGFIKKNTYLTAPWKEIRNKVVRYMHEKRYEIEEESETKITFRIRGVVSKTIKMYEDRITLSKEGDHWIMEGLRKDVMRISSGLEYYLSNDSAS